MPKRSATHIHALVPIDLKRLVGIEKQSSVNPSRKQGRRLDTEAIKINHVLVGNGCCGGRLVFAVLGRGQILGLFGCRIGLMLSNTVCCAFCSALCVEVCDPLSGFVAGKIASNRS